MLGVSREELYCGEYTGRCRGPHMHAMPYAVSKMGLLIYMAKPDMQNSYPKVPNLLGQ